MERRLSVARFGTYFHNPTAFFLYLQFKDTAKHRVSFYFCDFERFGRQQKVELFDYNTGELLASTSLANFQNGVYSTWDLSGKITVKFSNTGPHSAVLSGIFFDPVTATLKPPSSSASSASL